MSLSGGRKLVLGGLIAGLSTWYGVSHVLTDGGPARARAATAELPDVDEGAEGPSASALAISEALVREQEVLAAAEWPANPFFRCVSGDSGADDAGSIEVSRESPRFVLNAILSGSAPLAMINGRVVAVGDRLADGSSVAAIDAYSVTLQGPQGAWVLRLSE